MRLKRSAGRSGLRVGPLAVGVAWAGRRRWGRRSASWHSGAKGAWYALVVAAGVIAGCGGPRADEGPVEAAALPARTAGELIADHNARVGRFERLWARAVVEARWIDEEGKKHFEQGDGPLILRKPDDLALAIGKLGHTRLWLGSNGERYWLFDLTGRTRRAYVGKLDAAAARGAQGAGLPVPIRPDRLIELSGLTAIRGVVEPAVEATEDRYRVTLEADAAAGRGARRLGFDPAGRLRTYTVLDPAGEPAVTSTLGRYERLPLEGKPPGAFPSIPTRIAIELVGRDASMTLFLARMTDEPGKVRDVHFDFQKLTRIHEAERIVDLDRRRSND